MIDRKGERERKREREREVGEGKLRLRYFGIKLGILYVAQFDKVNSFVGLSVFCFVCVCVCVCLSFSLSASPFIYLPLLSPDMIFKIVLV